MAACEGDCISDAGARLYARTMLRSPRSLLFLSAGCVAALTALTAVAYRLPAGRWLDAAALDGFAGLPRPSVEAWMWFVAAIVDPLPFAILGAALVAVALAVRGPRYAAAATVILAGTSLTSQFLKPLLAAPRPFGDWVGTPPIAAAAFPSGHATASMALALAAVLVAPVALRPLVAAVGGCFALAVSFSIVALTWHFPSDVAAGYLVAAAWSFAVLAGLRAAEARWPHSGQVRSAARRALAAPSRGAVAVTLAVPAAIVTVLAAPYADRLHEYAERHTVFAASAVGMAAASLATCAALAALSSKRL